MRSICRLVGKSNIYKPHANWGRSCARLPITATFEQLGQHLDMFSSLGTLQYQIDLDSLTEISSFQALD